MLASFPVYSSISHSNIEQCLYLTIMKPLATPRQMKDAVREAAERGRSNF